MDRLGMGRRRESHRDRQGQEVCEAAEGICRGRHGQEGGKQVER